MRSVPENKEKIKQLNSIRGLFAFEIIMSHAINNQKCILWPFSKFVICAVAFFFFISAYSMVLAHRDREDYLNGSFIIKKPFYLLCVSIYIYILFTVLDILLKSRCGWASSFLSLKNLFFKTNWFIWELIFFYFIFYVCYKYFYKYRIIIISLITIIGVSICYFCGFHEHWYDSSFSFLLGILYGEYDKLLKNNYSVTGIIAIIAFTVFGLCSQFINIDSYLRSVLMRNSICIAAIMITILISDISVLRDNVITKFLTKHSTELFLSQDFWLVYSDYLPSNVWVRILIFTLLTILTALIFVSPFITLIRKGINKIVLRSFN